MRCRGRCSGSLAELKPRTHFFFWANNDCILLALMHYSNMSEKRENGREKGLRRAEDVKMFAAMTDSGPIFRPCLRPAWSGPLFDAPSHQPKITILKLPTCNE